MNGGIVLQLRFSHKKQVDQNQKQVYGCGAEYNRRADADLYGLFPMSYNRAARFFNTTGPWNLTDHYMLPATARLEELNSDRLLAQKSYWRKLVTSSGEK